MRKLVLLFLLIFVIGTISNAQTREFTKIKKKKEYTTSSGLKMVFYEVNNKAEYADSGDVVEIHYVGKFTDGKIFDSSYDRKRPLEFNLGTGRVIKGWEEALLYFHQGDSAVITIPPSLGYGERAYASIPANSTLVFNMKMISLRKPVRPWDVSGLDTLKTESGVSYMIVKKGKGKFIFFKRKFIFRCSLL